MIYISRFLLSSWLAPKRGMVLPYKYGCRSLRPLGCIGRNSLRASCLLRFLRPSRTRTLACKRERCPYHVQRFLCHRRTRLEINALFEDSGKFLYGLKSGPRSGCNRNLKGAFSKIVFGRMGAKSRRLDAREVYKSMRAKGIPSTGIPAGRIVQHRGVVARLAHRQAAVALQIYIFSAVAALK